MSGADIDSILSDGLKADPRIDWDKEKDLPDGISGIREAFELGKPAAVLKYVETVFARSAYPENFKPSFSADYEIASETVVVEMSLPGPAGDPAEYDRAVKLCFLRATGEVFRSCYTRFVWAVTVNGWAEKEGSPVCILSTFCYRNDFEKIELPPADLDKAIKRLKGAPAGPLAELLPVEPIFRVSRPKKKFLYGKGWVDV